MKSQQQRFLQPATTWRHRSCAASLSLRGNRLLHYTVYELSLIHIQMCIRDSTHTHTTFLLIKQLYFYFKYQIVRYIPSVLNPLFFHSQFHTGKRRKVSTMRQKWRADSITPSKWTRYKLAKPTERGYQQQGDV